MTAIRNGSATWVNSARPGLNYGQVNRMEVRGSTKYGFISFPFGTELRPGVTIHSATMQLRQIDTWTASVTVQRASASWRRGAIDWNSRPGVTGTPVAATRSGTLLEFAVGADVQTMVDTGANYGWRISTSDSVAREIKGFEATTGGTPVLVVEYSYAPAAPTDLNPSAGSVSVQNPTLQWSAGNTAGFQVQVAPVGTTWNSGTGFASPTHDSGVKVSAAHEYDLSTSTYGGISSGSTSWTVRVQNAAGVWSKFAPPVAFSYTGKAALTFVQPGASVWESSPPFDVDMTGLVAVRFFVAKESDPTRFVYDSGLVATTTGQHTPPRPVFLENGALYRVTGWGYDGIVRETTPGDPIYSVATTWTTLTNDGTVTPFSGFTVTQPGVAPRVTGTFTRAAPPDAITVRNATTGAVIYDQVPYTALLTSGTSYSFTDWTARPNVANTYEVQAVVNGKQSNAVAVTITPRVAAKWIVDPETGNAVVIFGKGPIGHSQPELAVLHEPEGSPTVVRRRFRRARPEGPVEGLLTSAPAFPGYTAAAMADLLESWADGPSSKVFRLIAGTVNMDVWLGDINTAPSPLSSGVDPAYDVSLNYWAAS